MNEKMLQLGLCMFALAAGAAAQTNVTTTSGGTPGAVPVFSGSSGNSNDIENSSSPIFVNSANGYMGIGTTTPGNELSVNGVINAGGTYLNVLAYNLNSTPLNGIKLITNIPFTNYAEMPTILIKGYNYGLSNPIGLILNWYVYQGSFNSYAVSSFGADTPTIQLASETVSGSACGTCVVIFINEKSYFERFTVEAYAHGMSEQGSWFNGWSYADASVASDGAAASNVVTLPYKTGLSGTVEINSDSDSNSSQNNAVIYSNSYNNPGFLLGNAGQATLFGFQYSNNVNAGNDYAAALGINSAYNGTSWSTWNGYIQPETLLVGSSPTGGNMGFHFLTSHGLNQAGTPGIYTPVEAMTITDAGNVGIGTTAPTQALEINGAAQIDGALNVGNGGIVFPNGGGIQTVAYTGVTCGGDYAESVDVTGDRRNFEPGDVLIIDPDHPGKFLKSAEPYSTSVSGIYSTKPGTVGRRQTSPKSPDEVPMAMLGIVPTKVSAENGLIRPGDLLVTSSKIGYAMKGTDRTRMLGAVVGKALGSLDSGTGVIEVVVTLQ